MARVVALGLAALAACASGANHNSDAQSGDGPHTDARVHRDGSDDRDAGSDGPPAAPAHVLLSEICLGPDGAEFVEIVNPTTATVDLSQYYLANHGSYFKLPAGLPTLPLDHFVAKFKAGTTIPAGGVITVATLSASAFQTAYGVAPTYSIADGTMTTVSLNGTARLTDTGALVVLFQWDGSTQLVRDVDFMITGTVNSTNQLISKSGYNQGGVQYATDSNSIPQTLATPPLGKSTKRVAHEETHETQGGVGNGLTGHDETSESTMSTWDQTFTAPTPNSAPAAIL
jgi:hypothetical protein